ncbi:MAG: cell wall hydrolase [Gammaproteobacteria bacterium]
MRILNFVGIIIFLLTVAYFEKTEAFQVHSPYVVHPNRSTEVMQTIPDSINLINTDEIDNQSKELQCLALNIYFEARSESETGQRAVGHVVMNRVDNSGFPNTVCEVVHQGGEYPLFGCQFSWWCDNKPDRPKNKAAWEVSVKLAGEILSGKSVDPTKGALWYHADYVRPYWKDSLVQGPKIGQHIFYRNFRKA